MSKKSKNTMMLPESLAPETERFIKAIINDLKAKERLDKIDNAALYILAQACNTYMEANQILKDEGLIFISDRQNKSIHPAFKIARDSEKTILAIIGEYGGTLRSRQKLKELDTMVEDSPLAEFLKSAKEEV